MTIEKSATEKLVDEISDELNKLFRAARGGRTPEQKPRDMAGSFITRIGKAVLSGKYPELDEALGVVGRGKGTALVFEDGDVWATWTEAFPVDKSCRDNEPLEFIALRKEEGQKEEGEG